MCKILAITNIIPAQRDLLISKVWQAMSFSEKDGYGACWSAKGKIGFYRSRNPFIVHYKMPSFCDSFFETNNLQSDGGALLIHGRTATCDINLENTHPFIINKHALIHNGVVFSKKYKPVMSSCDSEILLHAFREGGIKEIEENISGFYAFFYLEIRKNKVILDIVKDHKTDLHVGVMPENKAFIFATTKLLIQSIGGEYLAPFMDCVNVTFINGNVSDIKEFDADKNELGGDFGVDQGHIIGDYWEKIKGNPLLPPKAIGSMRELEKTIEGATTL